MPRLLCATDLLPKSEAAIDRAGMLSQRLQAQLSLLHVVSPTASSYNLEQALQLAITALGSRARAPEWRFGASPEVAVRTGGPARSAACAMCWKARSPKRCSIRDSARC